MGPSVLDSLQTAQPRAASQDPRRVMSDIPHDPPRALLRTILGARRQQVLITLFVLLAVFFSVTFRLAIVSGDSMLPTYHDGEPILLLRSNWARSPLQKGDVVLFKNGDEVLIKRIAFLPGEALPLEAAFAFRRLADRFDPAPPDPETPGLERLIVPADRVVVLGDNRRNSTDSRSFGPVALTAILGRVVQARPRAPSF